jgi:hypothetical protein
MVTSHKLYVRFVRRALRSGEVTPPYPFESKGMTDETLVLARQRMEEILSLPAPHLDQNILDSIFQEVPGLLPRLRNP